MAGKRHWFPRKTHSKGARLPALLQLPEWSGLRTSASVMLGGDFLSCRLAYSCGHNQRPQRWRKKITT